MGGLGDLALGAALLAARDGRPTPFTSGINAFIPTCDLTGERAVEDLEEDSYVSSRAGGLAARFFPASLEPPDA